MTGVDGAVLREQTAGSIQRRSMASISAESMLEEDDILIMLILVFDIFNVNL